MQGPWERYQTPPAGSVPEVIVPNPVPPPPARTPDQARRDAAEAALAEENLIKTRRENAQAAAAAERQRRGIPEVRAELQRVIDAARRARGRSSGWFQTGFGSDWIGSNTPEGRALRGDLDVIGANVAFDRLQRMRAESPTGGALGAITERELQLLQSTIASLDTGQNDVDFQRNMDTIIEAYGNVLNRLPTQEGQQRQEQPAGQPQAEATPPPAPAPPPRPEGTPLFWDEARPPEGQPLPEGWETGREQLQLAINGGRVQNYDDLVAAARQLDPSFVPAVERERAAYERFFDQRQRNPRMMIDIITERPRPDISDARGAERAPGLADFALAPFGGMEGADAAVRGTTDVVTVGGSDELSAIGDTIAYGGTYGENLWRQRMIDEHDRENHPYARAGGQVAGALLLPSGVTRATFRGAGRAYAGGASGDALRIAARRAGARQLAYEGAGYGGAYGFGSAEGDITDRLTSGAVSAAIGGTAAYGLGVGGGALIDRMRRTGPSRRYLDRLGAVEAAEAAGNLNIDVLPADVGGPFLRRITAGMAQTPFGSGPVIRRAQATEQAAGERLGGLARAEGAPVRQEVFGETAQRAADRYVNESGEAGKQLYTEARDLSNDTMVTAPRAFRNINAQLRELRPTAEVEGELPGALERFRSVIATENGLVHLDVDAIRRLRTAVAAEARTEGLRGTDYKRRAGLVLDDLREDIASQLPPEAAVAFRRADDAWRQRLDTIDTVIEEVIGPAGDRSAERVAQRLINLSQNDSLRFTRFIRDVPAEEAGIIRGSVIQELGRARSGQQNAAGDAFSLETFLTNWDRLPERTRNSLFGVQQRAAINDLARVAQARRETQRFANVSNTGGAVNVTERARALSYGMAWLTFGGSIIAENVTGRMIASPVFARWLAREPRSPAETRRHIARLSDIARTQPAISTNVLGLQQALLRQLGSSGTRLAAEPQDEERRPD